MPDPRVVTLAEQWLEPAWTVTTGTAALATTPDGSCDAVLLLDDELSQAGEHAEGLIAEAARVLRPGGLLAATAANRIAAAARGAAPTGRAFSGEELARTVGQRGFTVELLAAPGAAGLLAGDPDAPYDHDLDRHPGLLDVAPHTLVIARAPIDASARSTAFFAALPRKIVAAATVCRDEEGRLLVVYDTFRQHWTVPGGVVDADEDPQSAAVRETWEEAGVRVRADSLLGVFAGSLPDRLHLYYAATPLERAPAPRPVHAHEIEAAEWLLLDEALQRLAPQISAVVRRCLDEPGRTWRMEQEARFGKRASASPRASKAPHGCDSRGI